MKKNVFAIDLGNKQTKLASDNETFRIPSYYAIKQQNSLTNFSTGYSNDLDIHTFETVEGTTYLWGQDLYKIVDETSLKDTIMIDDGRYDDEDFKVVSELAIALLGKSFMTDEDDAIHANIVTGLPTQDFEVDKSIKEMKSAMKKHVVMTVDGVKVDVQIDDVRVMPQPIGSIYDSIVSEKNKDIQEENLIVVDLGGGTLLVDTFKQLNYDINSTVQENLGAFKLYKDIYHALNMQNRPSQHRIESIIREGSENNKYVYKLRKNKTEDITETVKPLIEQYTRDVISVIKHSVSGLNDVDEFIFTGGGSNIIDRDMVEEAFENVSFTKHGDMSNVYGFLVAGKIKQ